MKNEIYDNMLSAYGATTEQERRNAIFEVNQQVILAGLYNGGFFDMAAFYGGTCLRIFKVSNASARIWIFPSWLPMTSSILRNTSSR